MTTPIGSIKRVLSASMGGTPRIIIHSATTMNVDSNRKIQQVNVENE